MPAFMPAFFFAAAMPPPWRAVVCSFARYNRQLPF
jgi:hypothetical protein